MAIYVLVVAVLLLAPLVASCLGVWPKVNWNAARSSNGMGHVNMQPPEAYAVHDQSPAGVYAQERVEHWLKWACVSACGALTALLAFSLLPPPAAALATVAGVMAGWLIRKTRPFKLQMELLGHTVEAVVAAQRGRDLREYIAEEAKRTYRSAAYDGLFDHLSLEEFEQSMRARVPAATALAALQAIPLSTQRLEK